MPQNSLSFFFCTRSVIRLRIGKGVCVCGGGKVVGGHIQEFRNCECDK